MQKNSENFDNFDMQQAMEFARSEAGQQLLTLLKSENPQRLQEAMDQASSGNYSALRRTAGQLLSDERIQQLIKGGGSGQNGRYGK